MLNPSEMRELLYLHTVLSSPDEKKRWTDTEWETLKARRIALEAMYLTLLTLPTTPPQASSATAGPTKS